MPFDHRVLVLLVHPALEKSHVNEPLARAARKVEGVTVHDLYEAYPDFCIDKEREQRLVLEHRVIVLQFPLYWYSSPALLKEWQDIILEHGFAYGGDGKGLSGHTLLAAISAGSTREELMDNDNAGGAQALLRPLTKTAEYCGMRVLRPFVTYATGSLTDADIAEASARYAERLAQLTRGAHLAEVSDDG